MKKSVLILTAIVSSICTLLSTAPFDSGLAAVISVTLLVLIVLHARTTRLAVVIVFVSQIPLWLWLHRWVGDITGAGWFVLGLYMSLWPPLFVYCLRRIVRNGCFSKISIVVAAPIVWVGLECLRGIVIFDGYPWYLVGTAIVDWKVAQIASIGSVWSASFLVVAYGAAFASPKTISKLTWLILGVVFIGLTFYGAGVRKNVNPTLPVAVVQTNVVQNTKMAWTWEQQQEDVAIAIQQTYTIVEQAPQKPHLVVWPETMLPGSGFDAKKIDFAPWSDVFVSYWYWSQVIIRLAEEIDIPILVGSQTKIDVRVVEDDGLLRVNHSERYNSAVMVFPDGRVERYDKIFLTPFGERMPYVEKWPALQEWFREIAGTAMLFDLDQGETPIHFTLPGSESGNTIGQVTIGTPICFEDTVPNVVREIVWKNSIRQVELLINLSNDGWFGDADDARLQHIKEARMRCIENQTPMLRVANTGLSCYINSRGKVVQYAKVDDEKAFSRSAEMFTTAAAGFRRPLSMYFCDSVAWLCLIASILLIVVSFKKRSKDFDETIT